MQCVGVSTALGNEPYWWAASVLAPWGSTRACGLVIGLMLYIVTVRSALFQMQSFSSYGLIELISPLGLKAGQHLRQAWRACFCLPSPWQQQLLLSQLQESDCGDLLWYKTYGV